MSASTAPLGPLIATELRLHRRHHVAATTFVLTALWIPVLLTVPRGWRDEVVGWLLLFELATLGLYFAPALAIVERANGVTAALQLTRLPPARAMAVRLAVLTTSAVVAAGILLAVARVEAWPTVVAGVVLSSLLFTLLALAMVGRADSLTTYLSRMPIAIAALVVPALLRGTGLVEHPALGLSPVTGAVELLLGRWSVAHGAWLVVVIGGLATAVARVGFDVRPTAPRGAVAWQRMRPLAGPSWWRASRSLFRADGRTLMGDRLLLMVLAGVPLIAVVLRLASGPGLDWLDQRHGLDGSTHLPAMWTFVLVLHLPVMAGSLAGLLFLEDRDAGLLPAVTTTRASLHTLIGYRLAATVLAAAVFSAVGMLIAGAQHPLGWSGVLLTVVAAAAVSVVPAMLMASFARDRVQGMAVMKLMGLPLYAPVAWWYVDGPAGWLFALAPTGWAARASWATSTAEATSFAAGAVVFAAAATGLLARRLRRSVT